MRAHSFMHSSRGTSMDKNKKMLGIKCLGRIFSFIIILAGLLLLASFMLMPKTNTEAGGMNNPNANGFYGEPKNTIEIAVIGNSDAYSGISPLELWNQYGYTSYVAGEGSQALSQSLIMLKEILKVQNPKLVILETDAVFSGLPHNTFVAVAKNMVPVFQYHDRWKTVKAGEILKKPEYNGKTITKGQYVSIEEEPYTGPEYLFKTSKIKKIPRYSKTFLDMFVKTCKDNDIPLLLVHVPSTTSWSYDKYNSMKSYADEQGITFIDYDLKRQECGLDWKTDSRDKGRHLNCYGAKKITTCLGEYIKNNYNLEDHRNDAAYNEWNEDYLEYSKMMKK